MGGGKYIGGLAGALTYIYNKQESLLDEEEVFDPFDHSDKPKRQYEDAKRESVPEPTTPITASKPVVKSKTKSERMRELLLKQMGVRLP